MLSTAAFKLIVVRFKLIEAPLIQMKATLTTVYFNDSYFYDQPNSSSNSSSSSTSSTSSSDDLATADGTRVCKMEIDQ